VTLHTLIGEPWADYALIDSGHGRKLAQASQGDELVDREVLG
jgi:hypothetical protein